MNQITAILRDVVADRHLLSAEDATRVIEINQSCPWNESDWRPDAATAVWLRQRYVELQDLQRKEQPEMSKKEKTPTERDIQPRNTKSASVPCEFKGVSIGKDTLRLSISVPRSKLGLEPADDLFTGSTINATITIDPNADRDGEGQAKLMETDVHMDIVAESHGFRAASDTITASLKLNKKGTDMTLISEFANRQGKIKLKRTGDAATKESEATEDPEA